MATRRGDKLTGDLFQIPSPADPVDSSMDYSREVAQLVGQQLKETTLDRYDIAAAMSRLTGREVSKFMLDAWASESREAHNLPFYMLPALEVALETHNFSHWQAEKRGCKLLIGREALDAELGRLQRIKDEAAEKMRAIKKRQGEAE